MERNDQKGPTFAPGGHFAESEDLELLNVLPCSEPDRVKDEVRPDVVIGPYGGQGAGLEPAPTCPEGKALRV